MPGSALEPTGGTERDDEHSSSGDLGVPRHITRGVQGIHSRRPWGPLPHPSGSSRYTLQETLESLSISLGEFKVNTPRDLEVPCHISRGVQGKHSRRPWSISPYPSGSSRYTLQDTLESLAIFILLELNVLTPGCLGDQLDISFLGKVQWYTLQDALEILEISFLGKFQWYTLFDTLESLFIPSSGV